MADDARARVIAVTGGIGSGKSEVTRRFEALGVPVIDADVVARELVEPGQAAFAEIITRFGEAMRQPDGRLDRRRLRERVFADPEARRALEAILHPRVRKELREGAMRIDGPLVLLAIPLMVESGHYAWVDRVLVVDVPREKQLERVMQRDQVDRASAEGTVAAQASREARLGMATDVIINDGSLADLDAAVHRLFKRLMDSNHRADGTTGQFPAGSARWIAAGHDPKGGPAHTSEGGGCNSPRGRR